MRISAINTNQNYQSNQQQNQLKNNFKGNLFISEKLSDAGKTLVTRVEKPLTAALAPMPHDMFIMEKAVMQKEQPVLVAYIKPHKPTLEDITTIIIEDNPRFNCDDALEKITETFEDIIQKTKIIEHKVHRKKTHVNHYVPVKIGKPQKPFVDRSYLNHRKK